MNLLIIDKVKYFKSCTILYIQIDLSVVLYKLNIIPNPYERIRSLYVIESLW